MIRFYFGKNGKLVRDKIVELIIAQNHGVKMRKIDKQELVSAIVDKMPEEIDELRAALSSGDNENVKEEIADIWTLLASCAKACGSDIADIESIAAKKTVKKGAFDTGTIIEYTDLNPKSSNYDYWLKYFRQNPEKYIEEKLDDK
jgi:predicted house-cleaning noncanonical NTP pyrophosphatase (MazG superfamily)